MEYEEPSGDGFYTMMYVLLGILIVGLSGFIIYTLINAQGTDDDAGVTDTNTQTASNKLTDQITDNDTVITFKEYATAADIYSILGTGKYTVLAPDDTAFSKAENLPFEKEDLKQLLSFHIIEGTYTYESLAALTGDSVKTLSGAEINITVVDEILIFTDSDGTKAKISNAPSAPASNGQLFTIDTVLFPPAEI